MAIDLYNDGNVLNVMWGASKGFSSAERAANRARV
jgi:hypothetical protein